LPGAVPTGPSTAPPGRAPGATADISQQPTGVWSGIAQLGEYKLLEKLGEGGMGAVYKAMHTKLGRLVALKILSRERVWDDRAVARFEREMRAAGAVDHPNVVRATDAREVDGIRLLAMEFVDGLDLTALVRRCHPLPVADVCELIRQAAMGLQAAHEHGLVHRDVKPSNLMFSRQGQVKLLDLGLARFALDSPRAMEVTSSDQTVGTIEYMAPEQFSDSHAVDIRAASTAWAAPASSC
jgi:serine/threonine protein kinase